MQATDPLARRFAFACLGKLLGAPDRRVSELARWLAGKRELPGGTSANLPSVTRSAGERGRR